MMITSTFQGSKESCVLTSLGYALDYFANIQDLESIHVTSVFWTYIEYYRSSHENNGLSGKLLIDWSKDKSFCKKNFPQESKIIAEKYSNKYNYSHLGDGCAELLSTIMLHWVCQVENKEANNGTGLRGYEELLKFWDYCKRNDTYKKLLKNVNIVETKADLQEIYTKNVMQHLCSEESIALVLFPQGKESHSICVYQNNNMLIARDPNNKKEETIDLNSKIIHEYIIFKILK